MKVYRTFIGLFVIFLNLVLTVKLTEKEKSPSLFFVFYLLSDPLDGVPEGPGGWQSHGHDGVSRARQYTPA